MITLPNRDLATFPQFNGIDPAYFFENILPRRQNLNQKGILTFPFDFGYKLQNDTERYGKKIIPWGKWKGVRDIVKPNIKQPHNYAVMTGEVNGFLVIDYDFPKLDEGEVDGLEWLKSVMPEEHPFWNTKQVKTASGGIHFYLKYDSRFKVGTTRCVYLNGVKSKISLDMRTDGNCVIGEYSINEKGGYFPINETDWDNMIEVPDELLPFLTRPAPTSVNVVQNNTAVENLTPENQGENANISADKLKYINCLNGNEHIFGEHGKWWDLAKICAQYYNFNYFYTISQKAPSKSGKKQNYQTCLDKFNDAKNYPVNFGLLVNIIKTELPMVYQEQFGYINQNIYKCDDEGFNQILYHTYKDKFKYDSTNGIWYECCEGLWFKRDKENLVLKRLIADDMINIFRKREYYLAKQLLDCANIPNEEDREREIEKLEGLKVAVGIQIAWCRKNNKRAEFIKNAKDMFYDYEFLEKLDSIQYSGHLFSFTNGYIDLNEYAENREIVFHKHKAENYISMTCGYEYKPLTEIDDEIYKKLEFTIKDIMPDVEDHKYLLQALSTCMTAGNDNECIITAYGRTGGNGKGLLLTDLMRIVFGEYCGTFKTQNIVGKKTIDAESATSGLASIMNCRYVYMTEPNKNEELNNDALKLLSGGDELSYRKLHENMTKRKPSFTLFLQANHILNADSYDDAVWRRLKYIHFNQTFRVQPNVEKGEKKADITLKKKFGNDIRYRQAFIHLLLNYYTSELVDTPNIKKYIESARSDCDFVQEYIDNNIEATEDLDMEFMWNYEQPKFISFKEIKKRFKAWYKAEYDEEDTTKPKELQVLFKQKLNNWNKTYKTKMYERKIGFDTSEVVPIKNPQGRHKQKNWGECYVGYKFSLGIEEGEEQENDLDI